MYLDVDQVIQARPWPAFVEVLNDDVTRRLHAPLYHRLTLPGRQGI